jgi:hypothetical protein
MTPEQIGLAVAGLMVLAGAGLLARRLLKRRPTPEEIERRRRLDIYQQGKLGDGEIVDVDPERPLITYSYSVAGVGYTVAQEVAALREMLPDDLMSMLGPVSIKFKPHNPANSIVLCEEWSGLRLKRPFPLPGWKE